MIRQRVLVTDTPETFRPRTKYPFEVFFVEGTIGVGKSTLIERAFNEAVFEKVYEPLAEMRIVLERFYANELSPKETARFIEMLCLEKIVEGARAAKVSGKHLVVERIPWARAWLFSSSVDDAGIGAKPNFELARKMYARLLEEFNRVTFVFLHTKLPFDEIKQRIVARGYEYEKDIPVDYLRLLDDRVRILERAM